MKFRNIIQINKKLSVILLITIIGLIVLSGCTINDSKNKETKVAKISPSNLFVGETKRLEPHLGLTTGAVDIEYNGDKKGFKVTIEIWENGEVIESQDGFTSMIEKGFKGQFSISLKQLLLDDLEKQENMEMITVIRDESGYSSSKRYIKGFDNISGWSPVELQETINIEDDESIAVWGLIGGDSIHYIDIIEAAKYADWALVAKISFVDME